jgi:hypothetical protein
VKNVVTVRPGYKYGKTTPALVVAVIPGTAPALNPAALEAEFGVAFTVTGRHGQCKEPVDRLG